MPTIVLSRQAVDYIKSKNVKTPNVVIYRDIMGTTFRAPGAFKFIPKLKVTSKEPNELFALVDSSYGMPVWVEKGLLRQSDSFFVTLGKGPLKRLKLEMGSKLIGKR